MEFNALARQKEIYIRGVAGDKPFIPTDFTALESAARKKLSEKAFAYIAGGAGLEQTMQNNRDAFNTYKIMPRMLQSKSNRSINTSFLGIEYTSPLFLCPIGVLELAHPKADLEVAVAARETHIPMVVSNQASYSMEPISKVLEGRPWFFQLYVSKADELSISFIKRAEHAGARGIIITLDTTLLGWRNRDLNLAYLPFLKGLGMAQYTSDPVFQKIANEWPDEKTNTKINTTTINHIIGLVKKHPGKFLNNIKGAALKSVRAFTQLYSRPDLDWDTIEKLRKITSLPIILKGIQSDKDVLKCIEHDIKAAYISNHGGRQVDGAIGSLDALHAIKKEIAIEYPLLFDSGIRSGADIMKALAIGSTMVGIGRPYAYALALKGAQGIIDLIKNLASELELNMSLSGVSSISELDKSIFE